MTSFQLDHLQTLAALVDEGSFDAAARRLHVTPSAVSQRVRAMEQQAGKTLVQRTTPVLTTPAGDVVLRYARQVLLLGRDTETELGLQATDRGRTSMAIAVNADSLATWFIDALAAVPARLEVVFDIRREDQDHSAALLRSGTVMAAVTGTRDAVQGCTSRALGIMRYRAVCRPALLDRAGLAPGAAARSAADLSRLAETPVIIFDRKDDLQDRFLRDVGAADLRSPRTYVPTSDGFERAVVAGLGWGLLPEQQCLARIASGELVELAPHAPVDVLLYWQRWSLASPLLDEVTQVVEAAALDHLIAPVSRSGRRPGSG
ncbi:LysR family transcriptional regulator ArgP [Sanguibacter suarezii]|uniref:LysR family transcriptional regulator ArgP n=1 Tax=Sanguibacter suarezii TaxID=60921 RepID=UPI00083469C1|nr:LysR family transcriptional regulator ArgP [Sanguibacter suarezii]